MEFAMVLPLALLAVLGVVQIAALGRDSLAVAHAAREGAREAAVSLDDGRVREAALRGGGLSESRATVSVERRGGIGEPVIVRVRYRAGLAGPLAGWLLPQEVAVTRSVTMRQEVPGG